MKLFITITIVLLIACSLVLHEENTTRIAVQPMGMFDAALADTMRQAIEDYYGFEAVVLPKMDMPQQFFTKIKTPRYRADSIIRYLKRSKPDTIDYMVGFTSHDISTTKHDKDGNTRQPVSRYRDWGIFGLGYCPGPSCVVSTYRLKAAGRTLLIERLKKVTLHELGHNLSLPHCTSAKCFMGDAAETIKTVDAEELNLCDACRNKVGLK